MLTVSMVLCAFAKVATRGKPVKDVSIEDGRVVVSALRTRSFYREGLRTINRFG